MKRGILIIFILLACRFGARGEGSAPAVTRFTFGAEIAYIASFYSGQYSYFLVPDGFRAEIDRYQARYDTNSEVNVHFGYNFNPKWNLSLYLGYCGIGGYHMAIPVSLRATRYFGTDPMKDRFFAFADLGSGLSVKKRPQEIATAKIGGGYRLSLSRVSKLDFLIALRYIYTHPDVTYYGETIDFSNVSRSNGHVLGASLGIGFTF